MAVLTRVVIPRCYLQVYITSQHVTSASVKTPLKHEDLLDWRREDVLRAQVGRGDSLRTAE